MTSMCEMAVMDPSTGADALPSAASAEPSGPPSRYFGVEPVYAGAARLSDRPYTVRGGFQASFTLTGADQTALHPFKGLNAPRGAAENASGQRMHVAVVKPASSEGDADEPVFAGEAILVRWAEDSTSAMTVRIRLDSEVEVDGRHPLRGLAAGRNGEIVVLACWAVDDAEAPLPAPAARSARTPWSAKSGTQQSNILCRDPLFQKWACELAGPALSSAYGLPPPGEDRAAYAVAFVRAYCRVKSRSELTGSGPAALAAQNKWGHIVRRFYDWRANNALPGA